MGTVVSLLPLLGLREVRPPHAGAPARMLHFPLFDKPYCFMENTVLKISPDRCIYVPAGTRVYVTVFNTPSGTEYLAETRGPKYCGYSTVSPVVAVYRCLAKKLSEVPFFPWPPSAA